MTSDRAKGKANQVIGEGKKRLGNATGDDKMKSDGAEQQVKGKAQDLGGKVKNTAKKVKEKLT